MDSKHTLFTEHKKYVCDNVDICLLKETAKAYREDIEIINALKNLCLNLENLEPEKYKDFLDYLHAISDVRKEYKEPEVTEEAVTEEDLLEALKELDVKDPAQVISDCKKVVYKNKDIVEENYVLNYDEAIVVTLYTYEDETNKTSPYSNINKKLWRDETQDQFTNKKSYLRLMLRVLRKLPRIKPQTLYRGIKWDKHEYKAGEEVVWKGFSSTSTSMKVTQSFITNKEIGKVEGTLFEIRNGWGYNIADFSQYRNEEGRTQNNALMVIY